MKEHTVITGQSLFDVAITVYGDVTGVIWLVRDNGLSGPTDRIYEGQKLLYRAEAINLRQKIYLQDFPVIATITDKEKPEGIGFWQVQEYEVQALILSFSTEPYVLFINQGKQYLMYQIAPLGTYHTKITNTTTGTVFVDNLVTYTLENNFRLELTENGWHQIVIGNLHTQIYYTL